LFFLFFAAASAVPQWGGTLNSNTMTIGFLLSAMLSVAPLPVAELRLLPSAATDGGAVDERSVCLTLSITGGWRLNSQVWFVFGALVKGDRTVRSLLLVTRDQGRVFSEELPPSPASSVHGLYRADAKTVVAVVAGQSNVHVFAAEGEAHSWQQIGAMPNRGPSDPLWIQESKKGGLWIGGDRSPQRERFELRDGGASWANVESGVDRSHLSNTVAPEPLPYKFSRNPDGTFSVEELINSSSRPLRYAVVARLPRSAPFTKQGSVERCDP
jgi:hypothetical protein